MDEFRKPYEYEDEDNGGWLLVFMVMLITADLMMSVILTIQGAQALVGIPVAKIAFLAVSVLFMLFIAFTAYSTRKIKKHTVKISKIYLITRVAYTAASVLIIFFSIVDDKSVIGTGWGQFNTKSDLIFMSLVSPMIYTLLFSAVWYLYFLRSKRCRELVKAGRGA